MARVSAKKFKCHGCACWFTRSSYQPRRYPVGAVAVEMCYWCYQEATKKLHEDEVIA